MDINELRALQAPLKERYKQDPASALVTSRAEGVVKGEDVVCSISSKTGTILAGLHPATGGDGSKACSADLMMEALVACAGVTLKAVAMAMRLPLNSARVIAEGKWDARGTLGVDRTAPVGLKEVRLIFEIDSSADSGKIEKLIQLTEHYCVIYQTLANPPKLESHYKILS
ncbi:MAG TPA: OsmC family protein [Nitrospirota bacterium]|nr:OsmC family protein [Nitrospirota bacterium]